MLILRMTNSLVEVESHEAYTSETRRNSIPLDIQLSQITLLHQVSESSGVNPQSAQA